MGSQVLNFPQGHPWVTSGRIHRCGTSGGPLAGMGLVENPSFPSYFKRLQMSTWHHCQPPPKSRAWLSVRPHKGSWALPKPKPRCSGLQPLSSPAPECHQDLPWSQAPECHRHTQRSTVGRTAAQNGQPQASSVQSNDGASDPTAQASPGRSRQPVLPGPMGMAGQWRAAPGAASSPGRGMWWKPLPGTTGLRGTAQEFTLNNF